MPSILDLPGELRNEIYYAVYNTDRAITMTSDGNLVMPALAHVSQQVRRETLSIFEDVASSPHAIRATIKDADFNHLNPSISARPSIAFQMAENILALMMRFDKPGAWTQAVNHLEEFLHLSIGDDWTHRYHIEFNWRAFDISAALETIRAVSHSAELQRTRWCW